MKLLSAAAMKELDRKAMEEAISRAADAVTLLLDQGVDQAMAKFNG